MRVTITEEKLSDQDPATGKLYELARGDTLTVPDDIGIVWCRLGWAEDADGKVEAGERDPSSVVLNPHASRIGQKAGG